MEQNRKNYVAKHILCWLFNRNQDLALKVSIEKKDIALCGTGDVSEEEIGEFLNPWVEHALKDTSH